MPRAEFFHDALADNAALLPLRAESLLIRDAHDRAVVACHRLDVQEYERRGHCRLEVEPEPRPSNYMYWGGEDHDRLYTAWEQVVRKVIWGEVTLQVVQLEWETSCGPGLRSWVIADSVEQAEAFILDVERKTHHPGESILVFAGGRWRRNHRLYEATQSASFEDLVLADNLKETIRRDFHQFLESEDRYRRLGIAWRRGALLVGPPGNGKTHCVRALVKELNVPSLYVQSVRHMRYTDEEMWQSVFEKARGHCPCVLVLEDLDALINDENRSFFLNQLDGFERNHGLIVLATTNHPHRIDPAIINRPSRFDRKYHFPLPTHDERQEYLGQWQHQLAGEANWTAEEIAPVVANTNGFSFAYLKELIVSSIMSWMAEPSMNFADVLLEQSGLLQRQMRTETEEQ